MSRTRGVLAAGLLLAAAALTSACDPAPYEGPVGKTTVDMVLESQGGGHARVYLYTGVQDESQAKALGEELAPLIFPVASHRAVTVGRDRVTDTLLVRISGAGVYIPGTDATFPLDAGSITAALFRDGFTNLDLTLSGPSVRTTGDWGPAGDTGDGKTWRWRSLKSADDAPVGALSMHPQPWRGVGACALALLGWAVIAYAVFALVRRQRIRAILAGLGLMGVAGIAMVGGLGTVTENLGVAGWLSGVPLTATSWLASTVFFAAPIGLIVIILALALGEPGSDGISRLPHDAPT